MARERGGIGVIIWMIEEESGVTNFNIGRNIDNRTSKNSLMLVHERSKRDRRSTCHVRSHCTKEPYWSNGKVVEQREGYKSLNNYMKLEHSWKFIACLETLQ